MSLNGSPSAPAPGRRSIPPALLAVAVLVSAGAAVAGTAAYFELRGNGPSHAGPNTLNLTDDLGRAVTVPRDPARVAVLSPSIMDSMYRLGLRSRVVAVDCYAPALGGLTSDYSPDQVQLWNLTSSMCVQIAPTLDGEALLAASPQLVLASTIVSVAAVEQIQSTDHLPVLMLQPPTLSGIEVDLSMLGAIFERNGSAGALNGQIQGELATAQSVSTNLTNTLASLPTVLVTYAVNAGGPSPGYYSYGPGSFGESLIELACGSSISANTTYPYPLLTGEAVLLADPQIIVYGTGFGLNESAYSAGPDWGQLTAVRNGTVYGVNSNWITEADPTMVLEGLGELLHLFHPDLVSAP